MNKRVLYLSYNGMMEPLGASQVLSYLYQLSPDYNYTLVSLEKPADLQNEVVFANLKKHVTEKGINWIPVPYKTSKLGKLFNFIRFSWQVLNVVRKENIGFVHCRSYVTAVAAYFVKKIYPLEYLFDTRNFSFDERADIGSLDRVGWLYKQGKRFEKRLYEEASGIVILSKLGKETVLKNELFEGGDQVKNIEIITTCVDLERFSFYERDFKKPVVNIGYIGTAVGWYDFEKTAATLKRIHETCEIHFTVFNNNQYGQHDFIREVLTKHGIPQEICTIERVSFEDMPTRLKEIDIALFYIHPYFSKRASAATKLGELLASGIPVLTNKGVGDHEYYIKTYSVGKILEFDELDSYNFKEMITALRNKETALNCRTLSEKYFSLENGAKKYRQIYTRILND